jgi:hypothetical protein
MHAHTHTQVQAPTRTDSLLTSDLLVSRSESLTTQDRDRMLCRRRIYATVRGTWERICKKNKKMRERE